jgi:hypothetical protein
MGEGLGMRVRVPAVVTWTASANNYQLSIEQASTNFWAISVNLLGGGLPKSPTPRKKKLKKSNIFFKNKTFFF